MIIVTKTTFPAGCIQQELTIRLLGIVVYRRREEAGVPIRRS